MLIWSICTNALHEPLVIVLVLHFLYLYIVCYLLCLLLLILEKRNLIFVVLLC